MHLERDNDGTVAITDQVNRPMQGTFVAENNGKVVVAKGIVRPRFEGEIESAVYEAAFGKKIQDVPAGKFFKVQAVGDERCSMGHQTVLFSTHQPARVIRKDTDRIKKMSVLDLLSKDDKSKVSAGVPPSLLLGDMAPWNMMRKYDIPGVRATAYGSSEVPEGSSFLAAGGSTAMGDALKEAGYEPNDTWGTSMFKLLPKTAERLQREAKASLSSLIGKTFLIHRDPALPDGTSLFPSIFYGVIDWHDPEVEAKEGIVLNPHDPYWKAAGGDFDGDSAAIFIPSKTLLPRGSVSREDYKINGRKYVSDDIGTQMLEAAVDETQEMLGPVILGSICLFERGMDTDTIRNLAAAVAQGSVQSKKHAVGSEELESSFRTVRSEVRRHSNNGDYPYISSFLNALRNEKGAAKKVEMWGTLVDAVKSGLWDNGTDVEHALLDRILVINEMFDDLNWFRETRSPKLPQTMVSAAIALTPAEVTNAVKVMTSEFRTFIADLIELTSIDGEDSESVGYLRGQIKTLRTRFRLAATTGNIDGFIVTPDVAQRALIAYGPAKIAAQNVPAEIFEELGALTKRVIINIVGIDWKNGSYSLDEITPIPNCERDFEVFARDITNCTLSVIKCAANSTRVVLESEG